MPAPQRLNLGGFADPEPRPRAPAFALWTLCAWRVEAVRRAATRDAKQLRRGMVKKIDELKERNEGLKAELRRRQPGRGRERLFAPEALRGPLSSSAGRQPSPGPGEEKREWSLQFSLPKRRPSASFTPPGSGGFQHRNTEGRGS